MRLLAPGHFVAGAVLAVLVGCPAAVLPPAPSSQYRTPEPTTPPASPSPTPTPTPRPGPAVSGHVNAPGGVAESSLGLVATDGQPRLPFLDSGLIANLGPDAPGTVRDLAASDAEASASAVTTFSPVGVGGALVQVTDLAQRPYADPGSGLPLASTTDAAGNFQIAGVPPAGKDAIVMAFPSGSQRLTAVYQGAAVQLDLASTLATELLRYEAGVAGKALSAYPAADFAALVEETRSAIAANTIHAITTARDDAGNAHTVTTFDLRLDQAQALRNAYAIALSALPVSSSLKGLSDGWKSLLGHRPRAVTTRLGNGREPAVSATGVNGDQPAGAKPPADGATVPLGDPTAVAVSARGDIFVACATSADQGGYVRWIQPDGRVTSVALPLPLQAPSGLAIEQQPTAAGGGTLLVADERAQRVYRLPIQEAGGAAGAPVVVAGEDVPIGSRADEPDHPAFDDGPETVDGSQAATSRWRLADEGERVYVSTHNPVPNAARYARLSAPGALALDELGNLYIADRGNQRIRMIPAADGPAFGYRKAFADKGDGVVTRFDDVPARLKAGCIYTIAGNPAWDPGHTPLETDGHWFGDFGGDGGMAQEARLDEPSALLFTGGFLYVADRENQRVRRIARDTGIIETVAGLPPGPQVATRVLHDGRPTDFQFPGGTAGDGGPAAAAQLWYPAGLALDARDGAHPTLYVADQGSGRLRAIALSDPRHPITTVAGRTHDAQGATDRVDHDRDGEALAYVDLFQTRGLAVDANGNLLFADGRHRRLRELWLQWN